MRNTKLENVLIQKGLSNREAEISALVSQGLSNAEIANLLFITSLTVKFHLNNIYKKTAWKSRAQLLVWCLSNTDFADCLLSSEEINVFTVRGAK